MNILVFDIETVPDIASGKKLYRLEGLTTEEVALAIRKYRQQQTNGRSDFLNHYLHQIVAISLVLKTQDKLHVWSLGETTSNEKEIIQSFFKGIERYTPTLVSWNGNGFDLPVLHYRSLLHGVCAQRYWESGEDDQHFKWNNYLNRYHSRHTDLMDVLSGYMPQAKAPLDQLATILGLPGKMGMSGDKVWQQYLAGNIENIRNYCETDVLNTYLIYLRYELIRGNLLEKTYIDECEQVRDLLKNEYKPHFKTFLEAWDEATKS